MKELERDIRRFEKSTISNGYDLTKAHDRANDPYYTDDLTSLVFSVYSVGYSDAVIDEMIKKSTKGACGEGNE